MYRPADSASRSGSTPSAVEVADSRPQVIADAAAAKLDQIKDLYVTAEAIGEDALGKHFGQVSNRQHELIKEFFENSTKNEPS